MSSLGLDGVLSWTQAYRVARTCAHPLPTTQARLDEAGGALLGAPLATLQDDPPHDAASVNGYAICGEGPWTIRYSADPEGPLRPGEAAIMRAGDALPNHTDAVLALLDSDSERRANGDVVVIAKDVLTGVPDERIRPLLGAGIARQGDRGSAGTALVPAGRTVTPALLALAASLGHDTVPVVRPPVVGTIVLGNALLSSGLPRRGRVRDALGFTVPTFVGALGARGNPAKRAPDTAELLRDEIDDIDVDVIITTGSTSPEAGNHVRQAMRDLGARWIVDGVACEPGAQMLLARLPDGRFLVGLPGEPRSALAALVTLAAPLLRTLRGEPYEPAADGLEALHPTAVLARESAPPSFPDDTALVPVTVEDGDNGPVATPIDGHLLAWAHADALAVVPPGSGERGDVVRLLLLP